MLANKYEKSLEEMLESLKKKYDGYCFSKKMIRMYNPFSFCIAFDRKYLGDYWFEIGMPCFMIHILKQKAFKIADLEGNIRLGIKAIDEYRIDYANLAPLLFQSGYLTIKDHSEDLDRYVLGFPNDEVRYAFLESLMNVYTGVCDNYYGEFLIYEFLDGMSCGDIDRVLTLIQALMASIPYDSLLEDKLFLREHNYQTAIYLIFHLMG